MLENIINLVKDQTLEVISNNNVQIPADKHGEVIDTTASAIMDGFMNNINAGDLSSLLGLFGGGSSSGGSNPLMNGIQSTVVSALSEKVGLDRNVANSIATLVIPTVMGLLSQKNDDPNDSFNLESMVGALTGGKGAGGLLGTLGKLFS